MSSTAYAAPSLLGRWRLVVVQPTQFPNFHGAINGGREEEGAVRTELNRGRPVLVAAERLHFPGILAVELPEFDGTITTAGHEMLIALAKGDTAERTGVARQRLRLAAKRRQQRL